MNTCKKEFYKNLYAILQKVAGMNMLYGKTSKDIASAYNAIYEESKNTKEIAGALVTLAEKRIVHRIRIKNVTYWRITGVGIAEAFYDDQSSY